jgi:hypothetical protein
VRRRPPSFWARVAAAIVGIALLAAASIPTIIVASLITVRLGADAGATPTASSSAGTRPSGSPAPFASGLIASPDPSASAAPTPKPSPSPSPEPTPTPGPLALNLGGKANFVSQATDKMCASAAIQNLINVIVDPDKTVAFQKAIEQSAAEYTTKSDSRNGGWGPRGMAAAITNLSGTQYALKVVDTRSLALQAAATAIAKTRRPVILMAWRGAHAWVMTGYKANRDPLGSRAFTVSGAYILDPWYPRISDIWGRSLAPGAWHDAADLARNYLPWKRPEAKYAGRDGKYLLIVPVAD